MYCRGGWGGVYLWGIDGGVFGFGGGSSEVASKKRGDWYSARRSNCNFDTSGVERTRTRFGVGPGRRRPRKCFDVGGAEIYGKCAPSQWWVAGYSRKISTICGGAGGSSSARCKRRATNVKSV